MRDPAPRLTSGWLETMAKGRHYLRVWPSEKRLAPVFPEHRVSLATRFGLRYMPPLAVFTLCWQLIAGGQVGPAVATALFACSLPLQGLWWLGRRAMTPLPVGLRAWFHEIRNQLAEAGKALPPVQETVTYQHLAELLQCAFKTLDKTFLDQL